MIEVVRQGQVCKGTPIVIGRPYVLGNPFSHLPSSAALHRVGTRDEAVQRHREWLLSLPPESPQWTELRRLAALPDDLSLVCHCAPQACHGQTLAWCIACLRLVPLATRIVITGGRTFGCDLRPPVSSARVQEYMVRCIHHDLTTFKVLGAELVAHGAAVGIDTIADERARAIGLQVIAVPPSDKDGGGRSAKLLRNSRMLAEVNPTIVLAYPQDDSRGTYHCIARAIDRSTPVIIRRAPSSSHEMTQQRIAEYTTSRFALQELGGCSLYGISAGDLRWIPSYGSS